MARLKKAINYIHELCSSREESRRILGNLLQSKYNVWTKTLALSDFLDFNRTIMENKNKLGAAQFFGKFRAYAFEEYVYRLLREKVCINKPLKLFWGEKCLVWQRDGKKYALEFDLSIGEKIDKDVNPIIVFDAKVELDSARLKTALASFVTLKNWKNDAKCVLVYLVKEVEDTLLWLAKNWADGIYRFSLENNETDAFIDYVVKCLRAYIQV
ncbi:MAG: hypothetical protein RMJ15_07740 [Nitrososphaerota archaeon]|nr:hypothetical protein [Candidatus Bathyarchaeota archaeon]MDW8023609.1 hypothetical protein [Nitrososphaerota archaeon]